MLQIEEKNNIQTDPGNEICEYDEAQQPVSVPFISRPGTQNIRVNKFIDTNNRRPFTPSMANSFYGARNKRNICFTSFDSKNPNMLSMKLTQSTTFKSTATRHK